MVFTLILAVIINFNVKLNRLCNSIFLDSNVRCKGVIRSLFFIPNITVCNGFFCMVFYFYRSHSKSGQNFAHRCLANISMFGNAGTAAFTVILVTTWQSTGFSYDVIHYRIADNTKRCVGSSCSGGCTGIKKIIYIQLPLLMPTITINLFVSIAGAFKAFDIPLSLTSGGPANSTQTIALNIYNDAFGSFKGIWLCKIYNTVFTGRYYCMIQLKITRKREVQM